MNKKITLLSFILLCSGIIKAQVVLSGLVAYYPFNGNVNDMSQNANHATNRGAVLAEDRYGNADGCYYLNGSGAFIEIRSDGVNKPEHAMSISVWVKPEDRVNRHTPVCKRHSHSNSPYNSYIITTTETGSGQKWQWAVTDKATGTQTPVSSPNFIDLEWTHLVGTYDGQNLRLYVNGELVSTQAKTGTIPYTDSTLRIGHAIPGPSQTDFKGWVDDVRIYNRAISALEVDSIYSNMTNITDFSKKTDIPLFYPNPAKDVIQINSDQIQQVRLIDLKGKSKIVDVKDQTIDLNAISSGIYIFEAKTPMGYHREKIQIVE